MDTTSGIYTAVIVDDNELDRLHTQVMLKKYPFIQTVGSFNNPLTALAAIEEIGSDVIFLDIDMNDMNGLELRRQLGNRQVCIFITSYPDYALETFELAAFDYLVKPLNSSRFDTTMERLQQYLNIKHKAQLFEYSLGGNTIFIKDGHHQIKVHLHDILYLEALKDYTRIITTNNRYCVLGLLGNLLQETAFKAFIRIHRSYAVQRHFINKITAQEVFLNDIALPVGRSYKEALEALKT